MTEPYQHPKPYPGDELFWQLAYGEKPTLRAALLDLWRLVRRAKS